MKEPNFYYNNFNQYVMNNMDIKINSIKNFVNKNPDYEGEHLNNNIRPNFNYIKNNYSNNNQQKLNNIFPNYNKYSYRNNSNYNLSQDNFGRNLEKKSASKPKMKKILAKREIRFSIKHNNNNMEPKILDIEKENINLKETKKELLTKSPEISIFEKELLKVCIYIYFYEKILKEKNIFINSDEQYYLINTNWIDKFKEFTSFSNLETFLAYSNYRVDYNNLDTQINNIIEYLLKNLNTKIDTDSIPVSLRGINNIMTSVSKINNILFTNEGFIYPSKIIKIIKTLDKSYEKLEPKEFKFQNNFIYYINKRQNNIIISPLGKDHKFIPKYVFAYSKKEFLEEEESKLISSPINEYIKQFNCEQNKGFQNLINKDNILIGNLIIFIDPYKVKQNRKNVKPKSVSHKQNNINKDNEFFLLVQNFLINKKQNIVNNNFYDVFNQNKQKENELINENNKINFLNENPKSKDNLIKINDLIKIKLEKAKKENQAFRYNQFITSFEEKENEIKKLSEMNENIENMNKSNEKLKQFKLINKDKDKEITNLKSQVEQMKNSDLITQNKELEINKKEKDFEDNNESAKMNINLESNISSLENTKKKLLEEIKKYKDQLNDKKDLINKIKNKESEDMKKEINLLKKSNNDKEREIIKLKLELNNMKKDREFPISQENEQKEIENKINYSEKKENDLKNLDKNYKGLQTAKGELEINISDFAKKKNQFLDIDIYKNINNPFNNTKRNEIKIFNNEPIQGETLILYKMPTLIGLNHINSSAYINAILQCLSQTKDLTNYFLKEKNKDKIMNNNIAQKNPQEPQLCCVYYQLIHNLWNENKIHRSISPDNLINLMAKTKKSSLNGDAKDCIKFILDQLHFELKKSIKNKVNFGQNNPENNLNQYDKNIVFNHFMDEFQNETSIITDLFYGFKETTNICQNCKISNNSQGKTEPICYNYLTFNMLIFPLDEVMKYREEIVNLGNNKNVINLFECFYFDQKSQYFQGENKNYCVNCKQKNDSIYTSKILTSPNILVIVVNQIKENLKLDFSSSMDITEFVLSKDKKEIYELYGVITNLDKSGQISYYVASCKSPIDGNWYRYNDDVVSPISDFKKDIYNFGTPHVLFYEKQK